MTPDIGRRLPRRHIRPLWIAALALAAGCAPAPRAGGGITVRETTPSFLLRRDARDPALAADGHGHVALTWVTRDAAGADVWLAVSRDSGATFGPPLRLSEGGRVVSFPEGRPVPAFGPAGSLAVAWSEGRADTSGAVDLRVRASADLGLTLDDVVTVNDDAAGPPPELRWSEQRRWLREHNPGAFHGFPALTFLPDGMLFAGWLDGRHMPAVPGGGEPRIGGLYGSISADGGQTWNPNAAISDSACPCCRPDAVAGPDGALALAWRDASADLRDPVMAISRDGGRKFGPDTVISRDRWELAACPDQGPRLTWRDTRGGHYLWITGAPPAGVYLVPWRADGGAAGLRRAIADSLAGATHPMIATLGHATLLGVQARVPGDETHTAIGVRVLQAGGALTPWTWLGADAAEGWIADAGVARALACWVEHGEDGTRVRIASLTPAAGP